MHTVLSTLYTTIRTRSEFDTCMASHEMQTGLTAFMKSLDIGEDTVEHDALCSAFRVQCRLVWHPETVVEFVQHRREQGMQERAKGFVQDVYRREHVLQYTQHGTSTGRLSNTAHRALVSPESTAPRLRSRLHQVYNDYYIAYRQREPLHLKRLTEKYRHLQSQMDHLNDYWGSTSTTLRGMPNVRATLNLFLERLSIVRCETVYGVYSLGYELRDLVVRQSQVYWQTQIDHLCHEFETYTDAVDVHRRWARVHRLLLAMQNTLRRTSTRVVEHHRQRAATSPSTVRPLAWSVESHTRAIHTDMNPTPLIDTFVQMAPEWPTVSHFVPLAQSTMSCLNDLLDAAPEWSDLRQKLQVWYEMYLYSASTDTAQRRYPSVERALAVRLGMFLRQVDEVCRFVCRR